MKVVKSAQHYTEAARDEITLLSQIAEKDPGAPAGLQAWQRCGGAGGGAARTPARRRRPRRQVLRRPREAAAPRLLSQALEQRAAPARPPAPNCPPAEDRHYCCRMIDWFEHTGPHGRHVCMVFEVLGDNLLTLIRWAAHQEPHQLLLRCPGVRLRCWETTCARSPGKLV